MITYKDFLLLESKNKLSLLKEYKNKIYIKKEREIGGFTVWTVNGEFIRDKVEEEFTNYACHCQFDFIPENEIWIDKQASVDESKFYISRLLYQMKLIKNGMSYDKSYDLANKKEADERHCSKAVIKGKGEKHVCADIDKKLWKKVGDVSVYIVSGKEVRDKCFIQYTEGGHHYVYKFIPENEVWIDDEVVSDERNFVLLHEFFERKLMKEKQMKYDPAHDRASEIEYKFRHNPKGLEEKIKSLAS